jgi:hypothetical protein
MNPRPIFSVRSFKLGQAEKRQGLAEALVTAERGDGLRGLATSEHGQDGQTEDSGQRMADVAFLAWIGKTDKDVE